MGWAGMLSMAIFRIPLIFSKKISFWKLLGCGKNGTFDKKPDWRQWGVLLVTKSNSLQETGANNAETPLFFNYWWKFFRCEVWTLVLEPLEGHGTWDGKHCFGVLPKQSDYEGQIGVLTRASIRLSKLGSFWKNVEGVATQMADTDGFITSLGIGELPLVKQATFSVWESKEHMKQFAYRMKAHAEVIRKTKQENWYSEDMFVRFRIIGNTGTLQGSNPLTGKL